MLIRGILPSSLSRAKNETVLVDASRAKGAVLTEHAHKFGAY